MVVYSVCWVLIAGGSALAQPPGPLGKPPPTRVRPQRHVVPKWPRKPDPQPLTTTEYLDVTVKLHDGKLSVAAVKKGRFPVARQIKRFRGRFEARLYAAGLLLDVVRFDLPLTAAAESQDRPAGTSLGDRLGMGLAKGVSARTTVRIPFSERVGRVVIHDTLTRKQTPVSLDTVRPPPPKPALPGDLRTRSFGPKPPPKASKREKRLEDTSVLKTAPPPTKPKTKPNTKPDKKKGKGK